MTALLSRLDDYQLPWAQLRGRGATLVTADDTPLDIEAAKGNWANKPAEPINITGDYLVPDLNCVPAVAVNIAKVSAGKIKTAQIIGYGTDAEDEACAWILYAYRGLYSPAIRVAAGTAILGAMDCPTDPVADAAITAGFYVDTWGITSDYWGEVAVKDDADDGCSILTFDLRGFLFVYMEMLPAAGTVASFGAAFSGV